MRTSKRSPRKSDAFKSRLMDAGRDAQPIRRARRLQEDLAGTMVMAVIHVGFLVALALFARSVIHLFAKHGTHLSPWYLRLCLLGILVCFVLVARRVVSKVQEIFEIRGLLRTANARLDEMRSGHRSTQDD